jgi:hypothetical protein
MHKWVAATNGGDTKTAGVIADLSGQVRTLFGASGCNPQDGAGWDTALGSVFSQIPQWSFALLGLPGQGEFPAGAVAQKLGPPDHPARSTLAGGLVQAATQIHWPVGPDWGGPRGRAIG